MISNKQSLKFQIRYATETNTAYEIAYQFYQNFSQYSQGFRKLDEDLPIFEMNDPDKDKQCVYIFFLSTTGYGDPPHSMRNLWKSLLSKNFTNGTTSANKPLTSMKFAIYGLGDRSYGDNYNITGRKFRQRLIMLGAQQIFEMGLGDEQDQAGNYQQFRSYFLPQINNYITKNNLEPSFQQKCQSIHTFRLQNAKQYQTEQNKFFVKNTELLSNVEDREIYWVTLEYQTEEKISIGDTLSIFPQNNSDTVQKMLQYFMTNHLNDLNLSEEQLRYYLTHNANLSNFLNFSFFSKVPQNLQPSPELYSYINIPSNSQKAQQIHELLKNKLIQLQTDFNEYYHYIAKYYRNVCEVITDFSLKIVLSEFVRRLGVIIPRKYSIASVKEMKKIENCKVYEIGLLIKLQRKEVFGKRIIEGLCSRDLINSGKEADRGEKINRFGIILKNSEFNYPTSDVPLVMISLGTGIAPFLAIFLKFSQLLLNKIIDPTSYLNHFLLFHSYKYPEELPHRQTLTALSSSGILKQHISYTRSQKQIASQKMPHNITQYKKRRIQLIIQQQPQIAQIQKILKEGGRIFICGNKQFVEYIFSIFTKKLGLNVSQLRKKKVIGVQNW